MTLNKIIIHELKKESESNQVELILSEELIPNNLESTALITALSDSYKGYLNHLARRVHRTS